MYILDTDHLSFIQRRNQAGQRILQRLAAIEGVEVAVTVITYEEQLRGRLRVVAGAKTVEEQVSAYHWLQQLALDYASIAIVPFDANAAQTYDRLRKAYPRLGTMDLKIAAIAISHRATLLTRNTSDFEQIADLLFEDWSIQ
ncbi:type II toxin-antitoxin system VapC family toxin [Nodosilinea sp. LEGE 07088]|uniref:type II toxin-antitoxin system VapC family toxin n=1 Tax=Nodosilinea sp. LEGE 07088 TaxID=2777968 RepID=UPI00187E79D5|nr:type II toxin-antitoxin system VapC family toxin [Nodosilinea sp. LEGE 07088]MBE9140564.1 type II toxin-antitoxin system VapC family toxin [Nodosilinea sp. LEGE 07088]